ATARRTTGGSARSVVPAVASARVACWSETDPSGANTARTAEGVQGHEPLFSWRDVGNGLGSNRGALGNLCGPCRRARGWGPAPPLAFLAGAKGVPAVPEGAAEMGPLGVEG